MAGRNYGTMFMGYHYDSSMTHICYKLEVKDGPYFVDVAYHSKGQLIKQLERNGFKKEDMTLIRWDTNKASMQEVEIK